MIDKNKNALKVKKLEQALDALKNGSEKYFSITKLSSVKSLCSDEHVLRHYSLFFANVVLKTPRKLLISITKKKVREIMGMASYPCTKGPK